MSRKRRKGGCNMKTRTKRGEALTILVLVSGFVGLLIVEVIHYLASDKKQDQKQEQTEKGE
jgi:hypothetical protein